MSDAPLTSFLRISLISAPSVGTCQWLRFYDLQETLVLLPEEIAELERQRAEQERLRADRLAERLRAAGINP